MRAAFVVSVLLFLCASGCALGGESAQPRTFDSAGVTISYLVAGSGEPVVLIHGLHSSAEINWQWPGTLRLLAGRYQVIAMDVRGHGRSGKPQDEEAYGLAMVEDVVRLMDHLQINKAHIVGYSMGGMIALKFISEHPDRTLTGALCGMGWLREGSGLQKVWEMLPSRGAARTPPVCIRSIGRLALTEDALRRIRVPVVVIVGDRDPVKKLYVTPLSQVRKDWPVVEIEGAGHLNCIIKEQFRAELKKWLDRNAKRG